MVGFVIGEPGTCRWLSHRKAHRSVTCRIRCVLARELCGASSKKEPAS